MRTILTREIYCGVVVWNKSRKRNSWGKVDQRPRPEAEWVRAPKDDNLQIVPADLWARVAARRQETAGRTVPFSSGRLSGRPPKYATKNLLAGLATCALCLAHQSLIHRRLELEIELVERLDGGKMSNLYRHRDARALFRLDFLAQHRSCADHRIHIDLTLEFAL